MEVKQYIKDLIERLKEDRKIQSEAQSKHLKNMNRYRTCLFTTGIISCLETTIKDLENDLIKERIT